MKPENFREVRLWIKEIIVPACLVLYLVDKQNPELKYEIKDKVVDIFKRDKNNSNNGNNV